MLLPSEIDNITDYINRHFVTLEDELVNEMADRISRVNEANIVVLNQANVLNQMGLLNNQVYKKVAKVTNKTEAEVKKIVTDSMITSFKRDNIIFSNALSQEKLKISESLLQTLQADVSRLNYDLNNLTGTSAITTQVAFLNAVNQAHLEVISGAKSYTSAMIDAINKASKDGIDVLYPSGHKDKIEVATRRAIVTSVNQTNGELQLKRCQELGWDLVEVSAHIGARPTHAVWQGQVYSLTGSHGYKNFYEETEYGDMLGLCGINCRHTFFPFYEGSTYTYNKKELEEINNKKVMFNGKEMTYYQATQYQRYLERSIRKCTRQIDGNTQLLLNNKDVDINQVNYSIETIKAKKNGLLNELSELENQVGLKDSNRLYTVGSEVKLLKNPTIENTVFENVKKNAIIDKTANVLTDEDKKKLEKQLVYNLIEGDNLEELNNRTKKYIETLTEEQKGSIERYTGSYFRAINDYLRKDFVIPGEEDKVKQHINNIDTAFKDKVLGFNGKLFRGVHEVYLDDLHLTPQDLEKGEEWFKKNLVGQVMTDKGYQSTSIKADRQFKREYAIEFDSPASTKGMYINSLSNFEDVEYEFLLSKNTSSIITDVKMMTNSSGKKYLKIYAKIKGD